eukprot:2271558-Heterocapsa_arctica.AAC.2
MRCCGCSMRCSCAAAAPCAAPTPCAAPAPCTRGGWLGTGPRALMALWAQYQVTHPWCLFEAMWPPGSELP